MNIKNTLLGTLTLALAASGSAQISKPYWNQVLDYSFGTSVFTEPTFLTTIPSGAFVLGYTNFRDDTTFNSNMLGLYRTGASYFNTTLSPSSTSSAEKSLAGVNDKSGNLVTVSLTESGIDIEKFNGVGISSWLTKINLGVSEFRSITTDSSNNVYVHETTGGFHRIIKLAGTTGQILWNQTFMQDSVFTNAKIASGAGNKVYLAGYWNHPNEPVKSLRVFGIDKATGGQASVTGIGSFEVTHLDIKLDSAGNPAIALGYIESGKKLGMVGKIDGITSDWAWRYFTEASLGTNTRLFRVAVDAADNIVAAGESRSGMPDRDPCLVRMSKTGQLMYAKELGGIARDTFVDFTIDRFGEAYVLSWPTVSAGIGGSTITKFSTGGSPRWAYTATHPTLSLTPHSVTVFDRSGEVLTSSTGIPNNPSSRLVVLHAYQQAPVALTDVYTCRADQEFNSARPVVDNDRFPLGVSVQLDVAPLNGTLHLSHTGNFKYKPNPGFTGLDVFTYKLQRPGLGLTRANVYLDVR